MLKEYLKLQMLSPGGLGTAEGVALDLGGGQVACLHAKVHMLVSDGDGLRMGLDWMGHASSKPCWRHYNVLRKDSDMTDAENVDIACGDPRRFKAWPEGEFRIAVDALVAARESCVRGDSSKAQLTDVRQALGFKANRLSLVAGARLREVMSFQEVARYDWFHTFLAHGIVTVEAWLLVRACEVNGIMSQRDIHDFLKEDWLSPQRRRGAGQHERVCLWWIRQA